MIIIDIPVNNEGIEYMKKEDFREYYYIVNRKQISGYYNIYYCKVYDKGFYNCSVFEAPTRKECLEYAKNKGWTITQKLNLFN